MAIINSLELHFFSKHVHILATGLSEGGLKEDIILGNIFHLK